MNNHEWFNSASILYKISLVVFEHLFSKKTYVSLFAVFFAILNIICIRNVKFDDGWFATRVKDKYTEQSRWDLWVKENNRLAWESFGNERIQHTREMSSERLFTLAWIVQRGKIYSLTWATLTIQFEKARLRNLYASMHSYSLLHFDESCWFLDNFTLYVTNFNKIHWLINNIFVGWGVKIWNDQM